MDVEIRAYRPQDEKVTLRAWPLKDKLTHFRAEAHITDGVPYVWIDFRYREDGPYYCIQVDAVTPSDVRFMVEPKGDGEWDTAEASAAVYEDDYESHPLTLGDLEPAARNFAEEHFWNNEEV
jgi:hypothetical protein